MTLLKSSAVALGLVLVSAGAVAAQAMCACCENMREGQRMECCDQHRQARPGQSSAPAPDHSQHQPAPAPAQPQR